MDIGIHPSLAPPQLASPIDADTSDFGPDLNGSLDTTLKARQNDLGPLSPASVRLVTSPRLSDGNINGLNLTAEGLAKSSFLASSAWGRQSPLPRLANNQQDEIEVVKTPTTPAHDSTEEADEEKGRRLACEFLDDDFSSIQLEKVAEFLGGP